jgi:hypothetical protein
VETYAIFHASLKQILMPERPADRPSCEAVTSGNAAECLSLSLHEDETAKAFYAALDSLHRDVSQWRDRNSR